MTKTNTISKFNMTMEAIGEDNNLSFEVIQSRVFGDEDILFYGSIEKQRWEKWFFKELQSTSSTFIATKDKFYRIPVNPARRAFESNAINGDVFFMSEPSNELSPMKLYHLNIYENDSERNKNFLPKMYTFNSFNKAGIVMLEKDAGNSLFFSAKQDGVIHICRYKIGESDISWSPILNWNLTNLMLFIEEGKIAITRYKTYQSRRIYLQIVDFDDDEQHSIQYKYSFDSGDAFKIEDKNILSGGTYEKNPKTSISCQTGQNSNSSIDEESRVWKLKATQSKAMYFAIDGGKDIFFTVMEIEYQNKHKDGSGAGIIVSK